MDKPFHHHIRTITPIKTLGQVTGATEPQRVKGECFMNIQRFVAIVLCIHLVGKYLVSALVTGV